MNLLEGKFGKELDKKNMTTEKNPICEWTRYAQRKLKNKNWYPWIFQRVVGGILLTGAECPLKKDGKPNFRKHDKETKCTIVYPIKE